MIFNASKQIAILRVLAFLVAGALLMGVPALAQEPTQETTTKGTVVSVTNSTMVVKADDGLYRLFSFDRETTKPTTIPVNSTVRVISYPSGDSAYRRAYVVTVDGQTAPVAAADDVLPPSVRSTEQAIMRASKKFRMGVYGGVGLDPELIVVGVQARIKSSFSDKFEWRPSAEFAWGEVTAMFGFNGEAIYNMPIATDRGRWDLYFGGGPGFNLIARDLSRPTGVGDVDFSDFQFDVALNLLMGVRYNSGVFAEMKTSLYSGNAPVLRLLVGYNF
jgi:hypothetical protein